MNANWSDYERFLKPVHLAGQAVTLTIVKATEEETHPQKGKTVVSPVLWFREKPFGLILSPTNRQVLIALYGDSIAACLGKPITLQAVSVKVAGNERQPIRILKQRPAAPSIDTATGEITQPADHGAGVTYPEHPETITPAPRSELDEFFGSSKLTDPETPSEPPLLTEAQFIAWLKQHNWNGQQVYAALQTDPKAWLRAHPGATWSDIARAIAAKQGK